MEVFVFIQLRKRLRVRYEEDLASHTIVAAFIQDHTWICTELVAAAANLSLANRNEAARGVSDLCRRAVRVQGSVDEEQLRHGLLLTRNLPAGVKQEQTTADPRCAKDDKHFLASGD
nr:hypothetical protein [Granulicella rosea]